MPQGKNQGFDQTIRAGTGASSSMLYAKDKIGG